LQSKSRATGRHMRGGAMHISIIRDDCGAAATVLRTSRAFGTAHVVFAGLLENGVLAAAALRIGGTCHIGVGIGRAGDGGLLLLEAGNSPRASGLVVGGDVKPALGTPVSAPAVAPDPVLGAVRCHTPTRERDDVVDLALRPAMMIPVPFHDSRGRASMPQATGPRAKISALMSSSPSTPSNSSMYILL